MTRKRIADERRQQIIDGLYECLACAGHEKTTIKDIARAAGVSYGVIHYYFDNKKEIVLALVEDYVKRHENLWGTLVNPADSAWERLRKMVSLAVDRFVFEQKTNMVFLNLYQMASSDDDIRNCLMSSYEHFRKAVRDILEYGISSGQFADTSPERFDILFVGLIEGVFLQVAMESGLCDKEEIEHLIYETCRRQLAPGPGSH